MTDEDYASETRRRIGRHIITVMLGFGGAFGIAGVSAALVRAFGLGDVTTRVTIGITVVSALGVGFGVAFWSVAHNLRCPACDGPIAWQVSRNSSVFATAASKLCRHCGVRLFEERSNRRALVILLVAALLGAIAALFGAVAQSHRP